MSDKFSYYTPENMQDKKLSDLKSDPAFLTDAVTFLKSNRKGYKPEDIKDMSADDVVSEVLEHFRYQTANEVTIAKDIYFMNDDSVDTKQRESFGRLMFAFEILRVKVSLIVAGRRLETTLEVLHLLCVKALELVESDPLH